jgi:N-acetylneuraminate synthase/N,N'-diacetyllegionaminate synthase
MLLGPLDLDARVAVIAEIGNNHEGDLEVARALVDAAAAAGCDAVKLQALIADRLVGPSDPGRLAQLRSYELGVEGYRDLCRRARAHGLAVGVTPLAPEMIDPLAGEVDFWKVASGDNDHMPLIDRLAAGGRPVVISSGGTDLAGMRVAVERLSGATDVCVLHCVSAYPTPAEDANLLAIPALAEALGVTVGYSDHTLGIAAAPLAVALGARAIEKHITLDRGRTTFRDHALSADPADMAALVEAVRTAEAMLGDGDPGVRATEQGSLPGMRRSVAAARDLPAGHVVGADDLTWLRPGGGVPPGAEATLVGRSLARAVAAGAPVCPGDLAP